MLSVTQLAAFTFNFWHDPLLSQACCDIILDQNVFTNGYVEDLKVQSTPTVISLKTEFILNSYVNYVKCSYMDTIGQL